MLTNAFQWMADLIEQTLSNQSESASGMVMESEWNTMIARLEYINGHDLCNGTVVCMFSLKEELIQNPSQYYFTLTVNGF